MKLNLILRPRLTNEFCMNRKNVAMKLEFMKKYFKRKRKKSFQVCASRDQTAEIYHFRKCTDVQRMFHELSEKVMDKAFIKTREHFKNSYSECKSNDAWIEETHPNFMKCTERLQMSSPWLLQYLKHIERVAIQNTYSTLETQVWEQMEDVSIGPFGSDGLEKALFYIKTASAESLPSNQTCSQVRHCM